MISKWQWILSQLTRRLWFRASLLSALGVASALVAIVVAPYVPSDLPGKIGSDAVDNILDILASSLLAVTIFSLGAAVSSYGNATRSVTPRATRLLIEDPTTQNALATFLGAFLYGLIGIVALSTGAYGREGRLVMFVVTVFVILAIVVTLLRWIDHLSRLGTVVDTTRRVEHATARALKARSAEPSLGGRVLDDPHNGIPPGAQPVRPTRIGYVQHVDVEALARHGGEDAQVFVTSLPGAFVDPSRPLAWTLGVAGDRGDSIRAAFAIGDERSYDQDPRFGLAVLGEIASRALSPAVNDPGTAIDVIGRAVRVLSSALKPPGENPQPVKFERVMIPLLDVEDLFDDLFGPIARDGAALVEVQIRLLKALVALAKQDVRFLRAAKRHARVAVARSERALALESDKQRLREVAAAILEID